MRREEDFFNENMPTEKPLLIWFEKNKEKVLVVSLSLVLVLVAGIYFYSKSVTNNLERLVITAQIANDIRNRSYVDNESQDIIELDTHSIAQLEEAIDGKKDLMMRYEGILAEESLLTGQVDKALFYIEACVERLHKAGLDDYAAFDKITHMSAQGKYEKALEHVKGLLEKLKTNSKIPLQSVLLVQKAFLEKKLGNISEETYLMLKKSSSLNEIYSKRIDEFLKDTRISINDYFAKGY